MIKIIKEASKEDLVKHLCDLDLNDKTLYEQVNDTQSFVFQFSGGTASSQIKSMHPDCFDDMVAINCTSRPGASGSFPDLVDAKNGAKPKYPKMVNDILKETRGQILTQEEIMAVFHLFGFSLEETNYIRGLLKKLGKKNKKPEDLKAWAESTERLRKNALEKGLKTVEVERLVNDILQLSAYSFNKSHAFAYTYTAMETVYLSAYFKPYFYAVNLSYEAGKKDALKDAIKSCRDNGFRILPPDVNASKPHFSSSGKDITFGLGEIKGIGEIPLSAIEKHRPYSSIIDFIIKNVSEKGVTKRVVNALICGGAFDNIIDQKNRKFYENVSNTFYELKKTTKIPELLEEKWADAEKRTEKVETLTADFIQYENDYLDGNFFHGIFSDSSKKKIEEAYKRGLCLRSFNEVREKNLSRAMVPVEIKGSKLWKDKNGNDMAFIDMIDENNESASVPVFASYWKFCSYRFAGNGFYFVSLYNTDDDKIMFGTRNRVDDESKKRLIIKFNI